MLASDLARVIYEYIKQDCRHSFNVAPDINLSVNDIAKVAIEECTDGSMSIKYDSSKPNGQYRKDVDTSLLKNYISDFSFTKLNEGIKSIYEHYTTN